MSPNHVGETMSPSPTPTENSNHSKSAVGSHSHGESGMQLVALSPSRSERRCHEPTMAIDAYDAREIPVRCLFSPDPDLSIELGQLIDSEFCTAEERNLPVVPIG